MPPIDTRSDAQIALGNLRSFVTLLVVAHHSFIAYGQYQHFDRVHYLWGAPIVDPRRWIGFDVFVLWNDLFFMALMFFISGLFVWHSLEHRGHGAFLLGRLRRLGLPFAMTVTLLMPLAYYPSYLMTGADIGLLTFWRQTIVAGPWPGGPAWFVWVLLAFDALAALVHRYVPGIVRHIADVNVAAFGRPQVFFAWLLLLSAAAYLPMRWIFGPTDWFTAGPFSVQASRVLLYAMYFFLGVGIGARGLQAGLLSTDGALARQWAGWCLLSALIFGGVVLANLSSLRYGWDFSKGGPGTGYALLFILASASICCAMLAVFIRFMNARRDPFEPLTAHAYTIYLVHYLFVLWLQYGLLGFALPPQLKAAIVFLGSLGLSWTFSIAVRKAMRHSPFMAAPR